MRSIKFRNAIITIFCILWIAVFHYESIRYFYLNPFFKKDLPKVKLLFPPAGWIMFFDVDDVFGATEVYGVKDKIPQLIDPHDIFRTRTIGFDNIHRGIMGSAASKGMEQQFCGFLQRRFPYYDDFMIVQRYYPSITKEPYKQYEQVLYRCVR
jgi:hypothetical protein